MEKVLGAILYIPCRHLYLTSVKFLVVIKVGPRAFIAEFENLNEKQKFSTNQLNRLKGLDIKSTDD